MKVKALMLKVSLVASGCGLMNSKAAGSDHVIGSVSLTDTTGQTDTTFAPGQNFSYVLMNTTDKTLTYTTAEEPPANFQILLQACPFNWIGESVFAVSTVANPLPLKLLPGDTLKISVEAPQDLVDLKGAPLDLLPGSYTVVASHPEITGAIVEQNALGTSFTVTQ